MPDGAKEIAPGAMDAEPNFGVVRENDWVTLLTQDERRYVLRAEASRTFHTHLGALPMSEVIGKPYGARVRFAWVFRPTPDEKIRKAIKRSTQIVYPKDSGYLGMKLGIWGARRVLEVGVGSGALAATLAMMMTAPDARLVSYDIREDCIEQARENLQRLGLADRVDLRLGQVSGHSEFDAAVIDIRNPEEVLPAVWEALIGGSPVGIILPTVNQVISALSALTATRFADTEAVEIILRNYKTTPERVRPEDRLTAHTGYLVFGRKVLEPFETRKDLLFRARQGNAQETSLSGARSPAGLPSDSVALDNE